MLSKRLFIFILSGLMLSVFGGCSKKEPYKLKNIDGVIHVINNDKPRFPSLGITFQEVLVIDGTGNGEEVIVYKPFRFEVDNDGNIYIMDRSECDIKKFDKDGKLLRVIGKNGAGPGEFYNFSHLKYHDEVGLLVTDFEQMRATIFDLHDEYSSGFKYSKFIWDILLSTKTYFFACEADYGNGGRRLYIKKFNYSGKELLTLKEISPNKMISVSQGNGSVYAIEAPFCPKSILAYDDSRGVIYHCGSEEYEIEVFDGKGKLLKVISRPYRRVRVSRHEKNEFFDCYKQKAFFSEIKKQVDIPDLKPVADHMVVDAKGNLWVKTNEIKTINKSEHFAYDVFTSEGVYLTRAWLDVHPGKFYGDYMYSRKKDKDTGLVSIYKYKVTWSDAG